MYQNKTGTISYKWTVYHSDNSHIQWLFQDSVAILTKPWYKCDSTDSKW